MTKSNVTQFTPEQAKMYEEGYQLIDIVVSKHIAKRYGRGYNNEDLHFFLAEKLIGIVQAYDSSKNDSKGAYMMHLMNRVSHEFFRGTALSRSSDYFTDLEAASENGTNPVESLQSSEAISEFKYTEYSMDTENYNDRLARYVSLLDNADEIAVMGALMSGVYKTREIAEIVGFNHVKVSRIFKRLAEDKMLEEILRERVTN